MGTEKDTSPFIKQPTDLSKTQGEPSAQAVYLKRGSRFFTYRSIWELVPSPSHSFSQSDSLKWKGGRGYTNTNDDCVVCLFSSRGGRCCCLTAEEVDHQLVGAHHDGGVGDLPHQVGGEAAVQRTEALLPGHRGESLEE